MSVLRLTDDTQYHQLQRQQNEKIKRQQAAKLGIDPGDMDPARFIEAISTPPQRNVGSFGSGRTNGRQTGGVNRRRDRKQLIEIGGRYFRFDSKLEQRRAWYLESLGYEWDHHPLTVSLSREKSYTPDFIVRIPGQERRRIEDTKGSRSMKNVRDSLTRIHMAAKLYPEFEWWLIEAEKDGSWKETRIHG